MRKAINPQPAPGAVGIEDIDLGLKVRDDISALLTGLQHLLSGEDFRERLFALMEEHILPGIDR